MTPTGASAWPLSRNSSMAGDKQLVADGRTVSDSWVYVEDGAALTDSPSIISLARLIADADGLRRRNAPLGVVIRADNQGKTKLGEDVRDLAPYLDMLGTVAIDFPAYRNGRGYSSARILRDEMKFEGEIRAVGEVLFDQWSFMARCGFTAFEIDASTPPERFHEALGELRDVYQPASDNRSGAPWRRHGK